MGGKKKRSKVVNENEDNLNNDKEKSSVTNMNNDTELANQSNGEKKSLKRQYASNEGTSYSSDTETKRIKPKKKKIQEEPSESAAKKNKKSIRQMKREKHAERQAAAVAVAKDNLKSQCLNYLSQWKHGRSNWKFMKAKQVWLLKNKFSSELIPDTSWPTLLEYFESSKGNVRNILLADANKIITQMDDWTESQNKEQDTDNNINADLEETQNSKISKPEETVYRRARSLIQCLEE